MQPATHAAPADRGSAFRTALPYLFWGLLFGLCYTQPTLYYSNQNQYFLHGLAQAGQGYLAHDWLANTRDPTPVFSWGVALTARFLHESLFYLYHLVLLGLYCYSLVGIFEFLLGTKPERLVRLVFLTAFITLHSGIVRLASALSFGVDYPWYFQAGVAGQYVLGAGLQPSVFGVLLLLSVRLFLTDRPYAAVVASALAATVHSTYLLGAALLTLAYLWVLLREGRRCTAVTVGVLSLGFVLPVLIYNARTFAPTSTADFTAAQLLLVERRLPHHAVISRWCDGIALAQVGWVLLSLIAVWRTRLFPLVFIPFVLSLLLTLVQWYVNSPTLALLFPWRPSVILVPLATTILLTRAVQWLTRGRIERDRLAEGVCMAVLAGVLVGAIAIQVRGGGYRVTEDELQLLEHVRASRQPGDVYLLPVKVPDIGSGPRGGGSGNFTPAPRPKDTHLIAVDLLRFRLFTGVPIFVDFKAIPYQDGEVLEWWRRLQQNDSLYDANAWDASALRGLGITHVVTTADYTLRSEVLELVHEDPSYRVYRVPQE